MGKASPRPQGFDPNLANGGVVIRDSKKYTDDYYQQVFNIWYKNGKPTGFILHKLVIEAFPTEVAPSIHTLDTWIDTMYLSKAYELDMQVSTAIDQNLIAAKIEALQRHAIIGKKMQELGLKALENVTDNALVKFKIRDIVDLLVKGTEIERNSLVIPKYFEKIEEMDDEALVDEITKMIGSGNLRPVDGEE